MLFLDEIVVFRYVPYVQTGTFSIISIFIWTNCSDLNPQMAQHFSYLHVRELLYFSQIYPLCIKTHEIPLNPIKLSVPVLFGQLAWQIHEIALCVRHDPRQALGTGTVETREGSEWTIHEGGAKNVDISPRTWGGS